MPLLQSGTGHVPDAKEGDLCGGFAQNTHRKDSQAGHAGRL